MIKVGEWKSKNNDGIFEFGKEWTRIDWAAIGHGVDLYLKLKILSKSNLIKTTTYVKLRGLLHE